MKCESIVLVGEVFTVARHAGKVGPGCKEAVPKDGDDYYLQGMEVRN